MGQRTEATQPHSAGTVPPAPLSEPPHRVSRLVDRLVGPHVDITDADIRRRARLHSSLLLVLLVIAIPVLLVEEAQRGFVFEVDAGHAVMWIGLLLLAVDYAVSRSRHYTLAAAMTVFTTSALVWRLWVVSVPTDPYRGTLYLVAVPIVLASLLLPLPLAVGFVGLMLTGIVLVPAWAAGLGATVPPYLVYDLFSFVVVIAGLTLSSGVLLERSRSQLAERGAQLEEQTRAAHAANETLRELEQNRIQFLNQVAHDLANPLSPVKIQVELIRLVVEENQKLPLNDSVRIIKRSLGLFEHLLQDIRDLGKMEVGRLRLETTTVRVAEVVADVLEFYKPAADQVGVRFEADVPADINAWADPRRLHQILNNLVANAIRFSPSWAAVKVQAKATDDLVEISVEDKGRGLAPEEASKLFRPFSQVHAPNEVKDRGTGLGLYICKGFVEAHGGKIWVHSDGRGTGSTFRFTLPIKPLVR